MYERLGLEPELQRARYAEWVAWRGMIPRDRYDEVFREDGDAPRNRMHVGRGRHILSASCFPPPPPPPLRQALDVDGLVEPAHRVEPASAVESDLRLTPSYPLLSLSFAAFPVRGGSLVNLVGFVRDEEHAKLGGHTGPWSEPRPKDEMLDDFEAFSDQLKELLKVRPPLAIFAQSPSAQLMCLCSSRLSTTPRSVPSSSSSSQPALEHF